MPEALKRLINSIGLLPWIWEKSATKLAFFLLNSNENFLHNFSQNLVDIKKNVTNCEVCASITDLWNSCCRICQNTSRDKYKIAVVEEYLDMLTIEHSWGFDGVYHILWGAISPINGVFVGDLNFGKLFKRIEESDNNVELILATNPNIEWEATIFYLTEEIKKKKLMYKVKITRLSRGLSSGYIEYADNITLINALKERKEI